MAAAGTLGKGTTIGFGASQGGPFTNLAKIVKGPIKPSAKQSGVAETTCFDDGSEQFIPGFLKAGNASFPILYANGVRATLDGLVGTDHWFQVTLPDTHTITFEGIVINVGDEVPLKEAIMSQIEIKVTGLPIFA